MGEVQGYGIPNVWVLHNRLWQAPHSLDALHEAVECQVDQLAEAWDSAKSAQSEALRERVLSE